VARWRRVGVPFEFTTASHEVGVDVGWTWRIESDAAAYRQLRVIVTASSARAPGSDAESTRSIRSRGESAIDAFLDDDRPPALILVSPTGTLRADP